MTQREAIHVLIDELPEAELPAARRFLEFLQEQMADPVRKALEAAPWDNEPLTKEEIEALREARDTAPDTEYLSHEELVRSFRESA